MSIINQWKNPVERSLGENHPVGNILEEVNEESLKQHGGQAETQDLTIPLDICFLSRWMGNSGWVCTITRECQKSC